MSNSKEKNLYKLKLNNVNVPEFIVIRFEDIIDNLNVFGDIIKQNLSVKEKSEKLKELIDNNIKNINLDIDEGLYAVRSSANIEDGENNSFAGQFDTYLNVPKSEIIDKIILCLKSLYNENVLYYVQNANVSIKNFKMNIIIQKMIIPQISGVLFTANPQGILNESVIVVGEGVGENIVQDKVETTTYYYNLTDNIYYYEGKKDYLSKIMVDELINISKKIVDVLGDLLDIEFAIKDEEIFILQARRITTIDNSNPLILDNSNIVESYPGISLPLTCSFVNEVYTGIFKAISLRVLKNNKIIEKFNNVFSNMVGNVNGRIYYKISNWYTIIKFLPFNKKIIPIWQEMMGVKNKNYNNNKVDIPIHIKLKTYFNCIYEFINVSKNMEKLNKDFEIINNEFYTKYNSGLNSNELREMYYEIKEKLLSIWDITLLNDMYAFVSTGLLKKSLKNKYDNYEDITNKYISGISNLESMKPIKELINIAYFKDKMTEEEFEKNFEEYIQKYGDRNIQELKLETETFRTNKALLVNKIEQYLEDKTKLEEIYNNINNEKQDKLENIGFISSFYAKKCLQGIKNREIARLNRTRIYGIVREIFLSISKDLVNNGVIESEKDIFYLTIDEIFDNIENYSDMKDVINKRKKEYEIYKLLPTYSRIIFEKNEFSKTHNSVNQNKTNFEINDLKGIPCSNGEVEGEVIVIDEIKNELNVKDKIIVTKMTDPGWVFLLSTAKGIISEKGSLLSHTAIISRELKIPSIVGVENATHILKTGDVVKMNGSTGEILKGE